MKLLQAIYNPATKAVEEIFSSPGTRDREVITQVMSRLLETPGRRLAFDILADRDGNVEGDDDKEGKDNQSGNTRVREPNDAITSPKMSRLLGSGQQGGTDNRIGYYGPPCCPELNNLLILGLVITSFGSLTLVSPC